MPKRKSMQDDACPVARSLDLVGDRWSMLIVRDAFDGIRRFSDFQRNLGVAKNILSDRLSTLVAEGVLTVQPPSDGTSYLFDDGEPHSLLVDKDSGEAVAAMLPRDHAGQVLTPLNTVVKKIPAQ